MHRLHCEERHMEDLRDSVQVQGGRARGNTPKGANFFLFLNSSLSKAWFFFSLSFFGGAC